MFDIWAKTGRLRVGFTWLGNIKVLAEERAPADYGGPGSWKYRWRRVKADRLAFKLDEEQGLGPWKTATVITIIQ